MKETYKPLVLTLLGWGRSVAPHWRCPFASLAGALLVRPTPERGQSATLRTSGIRVRYVLRMGRDRW
jgi:hypothetical protein